ncbi:hypothetical protein NCLIV_054050 [Neospora caninum Liverpool]|uniref:Alpha-galactosidase n=1 Tax=Neospora caninum (strain Liverpool) TaxID=572307 RepID=F0VMN2_NEOCL|nr:hypothetical protein NCLIV_054050 [Neospora caninum Liverpool]CBZ54978.1 hypothetical protein NCLIV_054050 [Neospora caninum Liverpool]|eukprot:XP_003885006.1 hypothetical protein NCLIV_054050 [Neospora caninum Liverpool]
MAEERGESPNPHTSTLLAEGSEAGTNRGTPQWTDDDGDPPVPWRAPQGVVRDSAVPVDEAFQSGEGEWREEEGSDEGPGGKSEGEEADRGVARGSMDDLGEESDPDASLSPDGDDATLLVDHVDRAPVWGDEGEDADSPSLDEEGDAGEYSLSLDFEDSDVGLDPLQVTSDNEDLLDEGALNEDQESDGTFDGEAEGEAKGIETAHTEPTYHFVRRYDNDRVPAPGETLIAAETQESFLFASTAQGTIPQTEGGGKLMPYSKRLPNKRHKEDDMVENGSVTISSRALSPRGKAQIPKPPMGWNSWNRFGCDTSKLNEELVMGIAGALRASGLQAAGYEYVTLDDCWGIKKDEDNSSGSRGPATMSLNVMCPFRVFDKEPEFRYVGSAGHEEQDAMTFQSWGVDFLKIDGCYAESSDMEMLYRRWSPAFEKAAATDPDHKQKVVLNCSWPAYVQDPLSFNFTLIGEICDTWRIFEDIQATWESLAQIMTFWGDNQGIFANVVAPGSFNDPDMLEVGNANFSAAEGRTQMSVWSIIAAPLILGNDVRNMSLQTLQILANPKVIAVNQDDLVLEGLRVFESPNTLSIWMRPLAAGSTAVAFVNLSSQPQNVIVKLSELQRAYWRMWVPWRRPKLLQLVENLPPGDRDRLMQVHFPPLSNDSRTFPIECNVNDLWLGQNFGYMQDDIISPHALAPHDTFMVVISRCKATEGANLLPHSTEDTQEAELREADVLKGEGKIGIEQDGSTQNARGTNAGVDSPAGEVASASHAEEPTKGTVGTAEPPSDTAEERSLLRRAMKENEEENSVAGTGQSSLSSHRRGSLKDHEM